MDAITYFYDTLHLSADVIEFLWNPVWKTDIRVSIISRRLRFAWAEAGSRDGFSGKGAVLALQPELLHCAQCIRHQGNRGPASSEVSYIKKWAEEYGFSLDIVQEACRSTISATHQPSFEYTDSILSRWKKEDVKHLKDILLSG